MVATSARLVFHYRPASITSNRSAATLAKPSLDIKRILPAQLNERGADPP